MTDSPPTSASPSASPAAEPDAHDPMTAADEAELMESAGVQNSVAVAGPAALLMVPLAKGLAILQQKLRRR